MIGIFGGTFNPIHKGHLKLAEQALLKLGLERVEFLPCHLPVHRDSPAVDGARRAKMIELAIDGKPSFHLNSLELQRGGKSYMVDTLTQLKKTHTQQALCLLLGTDSFNSFLSWKQPDKILQLCHLVVCQRPGATINPEIYPQQQTEFVEDLHQNNVGKILKLEIDTSRCSSSGLRAQLSAGVTKPRCLPAAVLNFVNQNQLYETPCDTEH